MSLLLLDKVNEMSEVELDRLKAKADLLGMKYGPNIGEETLRERLRIFQEQKEEESNSSASTGSGNYAGNRALLYKNATALKRVRLVCMNPAKKDLKGEIITVANRFIGTVSKFIPFEPAFYTNGYHIPQVLLDNLRDRKFLSISQTRDPVSKRIRINESWAKEFAIEELPALTREELKELARQQQASGAIDAESAF